MNSLDSYYKILDIEPGSSLEEVKQSYIDLACVWHPDKYSHNPRLQKKAEDKLKEINEAYEKLSTYLWSAQSQTIQKQNQTEQPPSPTSADSLISSVGVNYTKLRDLLSAERWKDADEEMAKKMLEVIGKDKFNGLRSEDIERFPCEDLRLIDQLWVNYSKGRFGFSVQKRIWQGLQGTNNFNQSTYERFGDQLGWRRSSTWLPYNNLTFNLKASEGHLPVGKLLVRWWWRDFASADDMENWINVVMSLLSRLDTCQL